MDLDDEPRTYNAPGPASLPAGAPIDLDRTLDAVPGLSDDEGPGLSVWFPKDRIHLFGGSPTAGKSTILAQLIRAVVRGEHFLGLHVPEFSGVSIIWTDRIADDNDRWLRLLGVRHDIKAYDMVSDQAYQKRMRVAGPRVKGEKLPVVAEFERIIENEVDYKPGMLLVIDVFTNYFAGPRFPGNLEESREHAIQIAGICQRKKITIIGTGYGVKITNNTTQRYARFIDRIIAPPPFRGAMSTMLYITTKEESTYKNAQVLEVSPRGNRENQHLCIARNKEGLFEVVAAEVLEPRRTPRKTKSKSDEGGGEKGKGGRPRIPEDQLACMKLLPFLPGWPKEIARRYCEATGQENTEARRTYVRKLLGDLKERERVIIQPDGSYSPVVDVEVET